MGRVFNQEEPVFAGQRQQGVEVDRETAIMDADDGPRAGRDHRGRRRRVERQGFGMDIGKDGDRADLGNGRCGGDESQCRAR